LYKVISFLHIYLVILAINLVYALLMLSKDGRCIDMHTASVLGVMATKTAQTKSPRRSRDFFGASGDPDGVSGD
jgi:hypothetical protein